MNRTTLDGVTPFHLAFHNRDFKKMNILAQAGIDILIQDQTLLLSAWKQKDIVMVIFLTILKRKMENQLSMTAKKHIDKITLLSLQQIKEGHPQKQGFIKKAGSLCQQLLQRFNPPAGA